MPLSSDWWANTPSVSPFADNTDGAITAFTLRTFAEAISTDAASDDWFQYTPGVTNVGAPYVWDQASQAEVVWFAGGGSGQATDNWAYGVDSDGQAQFSYAGAVDVLAQVTVSGSATVDGVTIGTTLTVVMWEGLAIGTPTPVAIGSPVEVTTDPENLALSGSGSVRIPSTGGVIMVGVLIEPPSGETIESSPSSVALDLESMATLVIARQAAVASAITT